MKPTRGIRIGCVAVSLALFPALAGCAGSRPSSPPSPSTSSAAPTGAVESADRVCTLKTAAGVTVVHLRLPSDWTFVVPDADADGGSCAWTHDTISFSVSDASPRPDEEGIDRSLESAYRDLLADQGVDTDDDTENVALDRRVTVFPGVSGDRLEFYIYDDGTPQDVIRAQGAGIELAISRDAEDRRRTESEQPADLRASFDRITATVEIEPR